MQTNCCTATRALLADQVGLLSSFQMIADASNKGWLFTFQLFLCSFLKLCRSFLNGILDFLILFGQFCLLLVVLYHVGLICCLNTVCFVKKIILDAKVVVPGAKAWRVLTDNSSMFLCFLLTGVGLLSDVWRCKDLISGDASNRPSALTVPVWCCIQPRNFCKKFDKIVHETYMKWVYFTTFTKHYTLASQYSADVANDKVLSRWLLAPCCSRGACDGG